MLFLKKLFYKKNTNSEKKPLLKQHPNDHKLDEYFHDITIKPKPSKDFYDESQKFIKEIKAMNSELHDVKSAAKLTIVKHNGLYVINNFDSQTMDFINNNLDKLTLKSKLNSCLPLHFSYVQLESLHILLKKEKELKELLTVIAPKMISKQFCNIDTDSASLFIYKGTDNNIYITDPPNAFTVFLEKNTGALKMEGHDLKVTKGTGIKFSAEQFKALIKLLQLNELEQELDKSSCCSCCSCNLQ